MRLVANWRAVLQRAWSVRLMLLAAILSGIEVAMPFLDGVLPVEPSVFAALSGLAVTLAFVAQRKIGDDQ